MPRRVGLVGLPMVAALVLAGCHWGTYQNVPGHPGPQPYTVTLHEQNSAETIWNCTASTQTEYKRAECALAVVRWTCHADPLPGWDSARCLAATDYTSNTGCNRVPGGLESCVQSMRRAIAAVLGDKECLAYEYHAGFGPSYGWFGADHGFTGCP